MPRLAFCLVRMCRRRGMIKEGFRLGSFQYTFLRSYFTRNEAAFEKRLYTDFHATCGVSCRLFTHAFFDIASIFFTIFPPKMRISHARRFDRFSAVQAVWNRSPIINIAAVLLFAGRFDFTDFHDTVEGGNVAGFSACTGSVVSPNVYACTTGFSR